MVSVKGEVSNCKYHPSGHIYFTLKDSASALNCIMFAGDRRGLGFRLTEGQQVIAKGSVSVFERDGRYQLYVKEVTLDGAGALYEKYEQLKRELAEEGMFAPEYKQQIPKYIHTLGVVTADTGAAVRDIIQIASRRNPYVQIILYPALVQGASAAPSIVNGIHALERQGVDVMIVGRGGGSIEDLWAFNEEEVARALRAGARIIGVNNRNLKDFTVDVKNSVRLRALIPPEVLYVSESGIRGAEDVAVLYKNGTDAVLIGETLMRSSDKAAMLQELKRDCHE